MDEFGCNPSQANTSGSPSHNGLYQMGPGELKEGGWNGTWQELAQQPLSEQLEVWGRYLQNRDRTGVLARSSHGTNHRRSEN